MKIGFVSLGCSKNLVDTEMMIKLYEDRGYEIVANPAEAEIIVINTCGFIESAKQEASDTILEMAEYKEFGNCESLIVTGCLVERYLDELKAELPEVDLFIPIRDYEKVFESLDFAKRKITTENFAYLKIAEGCSNNCTYCAIPYIRGKYLSRPFEDIIKEAKDLYSKGYKEIIVIADAFYRDAIDMQMRARGDFYEKRSTMEQLVGHEAFVEFEKIISKRQGNEDIIITPINQSEFIDNQQTTPDDKEPDL